MTRLIFAASANVAIIAAAFTAAAPANAVDRAGLSRAASANGVTVHRGSSLPTTDFRRDRDRQRDRGFDDTLYVDREYQGDTAWRPESFNDWWHERSARNQPRWLRSNNCERQYWTGGGWRC